MRPLLTNAAIKPAAADIRVVRDAFRDQLAIRASSTLFRLRSAEDIHQRLRFVNTGPNQEPTVLAGELNRRAWRAPASNGCCTWSTSARLRRR